MKKLYPFLAVLILLGSCVSTKKYDQALQESEQWKNRYSKCDTERENLSNEVAALREDTAGLWIDLKTVMDDYTALKASTDKQQEDLTVQLQKKEEELEAYAIFLTEKEERVKELQGLLNRKDSLTRAILTKVEVALRNYDKEDLTVQMKEGKVYVSLSEKLLFKSGSHEVNQEGAQALEKLAQVLNNNGDIQVMIEGHTDSIPMRQGNISDNWDLSVLRATSVVKILTDRYEVSGGRLVACGKGEFKPIAPNSSEEGRHSNRRTEIILTPQLSELFDLLNETAMEP